MLPRLILAGDNQRERHQMRITKRVKAVIVTAAIAGVLGVASFAVAAYLSTSTAEVTGSFASWTSPGVVGDAVGPLIPGQSTDVRLTVTNNNTVAGQIVGVTAKSVTVDGDDSGKCAGYLVQKGLETLPTGPVAAGATAVITVPGGLAMKDEGDQIACQGKTFSATWDVQFRVATGSAAPESPTV
jgi:hypothetical protein